MSTDDASVLLVAAGDLDVEDVEVLTRLAAQVRRADPVPAGLVERICLAIALEELEADIAHLELVGEPLLAVRSDEPTIAADTITFTTDVLTVMISVRAEGDVVRVDGWVAPAERLRVELHRGADVRTGESDDDGRFSFPDLERGPARLLLRRHDGSGVPVVTPQIEL